MNERLTEQKALETEIKTVDTLLDQGVRVDLPAPRILRWLGKPVLRLILRRPNSETLYRISGLYLRMMRQATTLEPGTLGESHQLIHECMLPASQIVAYGIAPYFRPSGIGNRLLAHYLRKHLDTRAMAELWMMVTSLSGAHDFCNFIRSMSGMRITTPRTI